MANAAPPSVNVTFYDAYAPTLSAGEYTLTVSQSLQTDAGESITPPPAPVTQRLLVRGPRFSLQAARVHRAFPPPDTAGDYASHLPMLVLKDCALPWERELAMEADVYTATRHQREVGAGYFDEVAKVLSGGQAATLAMEGSTESDQFENA